MITVGEIQFEVHRFKALVLFFSNFIYSQSLSLPSVADGFEFLVDQLDVVEIGFNLEVFNITEMGHELKLIYFFAVLGQWLAGSSSLDLSLKLAVSWLLFPQAWSVFFGYLSLNDMGELIWIVAQDVSVSEL
jgi:hypothetical protein